VAQALYGHTPVPQLTEGPWQRDVQKAGPLLAGSPKGLTGEACKTPGRAWANLQTQGQEMQRAEGIWLGLLASPSGKGPTLGRSV
jgi:hypothetical protein